MTGKNTTLIHSFSIYNLFTKTIGRDVAVLPVQNQWLQDVTSSRSAQSLLFLITTKHTFSITFIHSFIYLLLLIDSFIYFYSFIHLFTFIHSFIYLLLFIHSFIYFYSFIHLFTHSLKQNTNVLKWKILYKQAE